MKARIAFAALVSALALTLLADSTTVEGTVRSIDPDELRVVIVTPDGNIVAAYGTEDTPVRFEGSIYRVGNLEVGDRIRLTLTGDGEEQQVEAIDVIESVPPSQRPTPRPAAEPTSEVILSSTGAGTTLTSVRGKVDQTRADRSLFRIIAEGGLSWVRIDATNARTPDGTPFRVADLTFGEMIEATGSIGSNGELVATTIRRESELGTGTPPPVMIPVPSERPDDAPAPTSVYTPREIRWLDVVEFEGEIVNPLDGTQQLTIRNDDTGANDVVWCDSQFVALVDEEDPTPVSDLEEGMHVQVRALRVSEGLVAQSINVDD